MISSKADLAKLRMQDSGTCTRCVLHINLRDEPSSDWRCDVSLVQKYHYAEELTSSPLYPWAEMEQEITPFTTVYDKRELEHVIRRAQLATLNPSQNPRLFSPLREVLSTSTEVAFSPNIISLEIAAPGLPNLSFYDLPGKDRVHHGLRVVVLTNRQVSSPNSTMDARTRQG